MTSFVLQARKNGSEEQELAILKDKLASIEDKKKLEIVRLKNAIELLSTATVGRSSLILP